MQADKSHHHLVETIRDTIAAHLTEGQPTIRSIALKTGTNVRTLQRRLCDAGTTYSRLVDEVRLATACRLLEGGDRLMSDIAMELGYADPAHFSRAFFRLTGMSPRDYRRRRGNMSQPQRTDRTDRPNA